MRNFISKCYTFATNVFVNEQKKLEDFTLSNFGITFFGVNLLTTSFRVIFQHLTKSSLLKLSEKM